jgi:hypothetical protein
VECLGDDIQPGLAFAIVIGAMTLFVWGRPRYRDVISVAVPALLLVWPVR